MELIVVPRVKTQDAINLYGGVKYRLASALGVSRQAIDNFGEYLPEERARKIYELFPEKFKNHGTKAA